MRNIQVSTDVFAAIWKKRQDGEQNEDAILARLLGVKMAEPAEPPGSGGKKGFDKVAYQRAYMRQRRAKEREARATR